MNVGSRKLLLAAGMSGSFGLMAFSMQTAADVARPAGIYTLEQARAGKVAVEASCAHCHLSSMRGRVGAAGELPEVESLKPAYRKFVEGAGGFVPPLAGEEFMTKWGSKALDKFAIEQILGAMQTFGPPGVAKDDPRVFLEITAYLLQLNGAPAGNRPLLREDVTPLASAVNR